MRASFKALCLSGLLAILFTACGQDDPAAPVPVCEEAGTGPVHTLQSAKAAWAAAGQSTYSFDQRHSCECGAGLFGNVRITVRNNRITGVVRLDNGQRIPRDEWQYLSTVDALFQRVENLEASNPYQLTVEYSPKYGYPTLIYVDLFEDQNVVDDISVVHAGCLSFP